MLTDRLRIDGPDHPEALAVRNNLARLLGETGDPVGAAVAFERLAADRERILGPDHPETVRTRENAASWRSRVDELKDVARLTTQIGYGANPVLDESP